MLAKHVSYLGYQKRVAVSRAGVSGKWYNLAGKRETFALINGVVAPIQNSNKPKSNRLLIARTAFESMSLAGCEHQRTLTAVRTNQRQSVSTSAACVRAELLRILSLLSDHNRHSVVLELVVQGLL